MEEEIDVYEKETTDGNRVLLTTHHLMFSLGSFSRNAGRVSLSVCDISDVSKQQNVISHALLITTRLSQEFKLKFKNKSIVQTFYDLLVFRIQQTKVGK